MRRKPLPMHSGLKFGKLTLVSETRVNNRKHWLCVCECGNTKVAEAGGLRAGTVKSCGCLMVGRPKHGLCNSPEYRSWDHAKQRCSNPNNDATQHYLGRGIRMCDRWLNSFENFYADMGPRPSLQHTLDRYPDNDGNYEPGNCRWATKSQQTENSGRILEIRARGNYCKRGHEFTPENTVMHGGYRECRKCTIILKRARRARGIR